MRSEKLFQLADIQTGPFGSQLHKEDYVKIGTPIVTVEHLGKKKFTEQNLPCVSEQDKKRLEKYILKSGDIVFSRVGAVDRCSFVSHEYDGWMFSGRCLRVRPHNNIYPEYLWQGEIAEKENKVYETVRSTFILAELDKQHIGMKEWNPLGEYISPGDTVLLKPNWVENKNKKHIHAIYIIIVSISTSITQSLCTYYDKSWTIILILYNLYYIIF